MQVKKNPEQQLENFSKIFLQIGLVLALFITYSLIEYKTYNKGNPRNLDHVTIKSEIKEDIPIVTIKEEKPPAKINPVLVEKIKIVEDEIKMDETIIESTETDENEAVIIVNTDDIVEVKETEVIVEDIPFLIIENVPVYPGCVGDNTELQKCFTKKITAFFSKNFNANLPSELGLSSGNKKLFVVFRIDKTGKVTNVKARAPHPRLEKEVVEIINSLPQMIPGNQRGTPVSVSYSLPITLLVE
jgi:protein TonB